MLNSSPKSFHLSLAISLLCFHDPAPRCGMKQRTGPACESSSVSSRAERSAPRRFDPDLSAHADIPASRFKHANDTAFDLHPLTDFNSPPTPRRNQSTQQGMMRRHLTLILDGRIEVLKFVVPEFLEDLAEKRD